MGRMKRAVQSELTTMGEFFRWLKPGDRGMLWVKIGAAVLALYSAVFIAEGQGLLVRIGYAAAGAVGGGLLAARMDQHYDDGPWSRRFITLGAAVLLLLATVSIGEALLT